MVSTRMKKKQVKESICYKCSNPESSHYLVNYTDGIAQTEGVKICPTVVFVKRNY